MTQQEPELGESIASLCGGGAGLLRDPHVGIAPTETWRHDAVKDKSLVDDAGIGAESRYPSLVTHDKDGRSGGFIVGGLRDAAQKRGHAEKFKGTRSDEIAVKALGAFAGAVEDVH